MLFSVKLCGCVAIRKLESRKYRIILYSAFSPSPPGLYSLSTIVKIGDRNLDDRQW